jgi:uncharacterized protein (DUF983 family)
MSSSGPFDDLEPPAPPTQGERRVGAMTVLFRGATRRCPRCGGRGLFAGPFTIRRTCPTCGLRLEREEGGFLGAMTINYSVTMLLWAVLLAVWLVVDLPEVHVVALTVVSRAVPARVLVVLKDDLGGDRSARLPDRSGVPVTIRGRPGVGQRGTCLACRERAQGFLGVPNGGVAHFWSDGDMDREYPPTHRPRERLDGDAAGAIGRRGRRIGTGADLR